MDPAQAKKAIRSFAQFGVDNLHERSPTQRDRMQSELQRCLEALDENARTEIVDQYEQWADQKLEPLHREASILVTLLQLAQIETPPRPSDSALNYVRGYLESGIEHHAQQFQNAHDFSSLLSEAHIALRRDTRKKR